MPERYQINLNRGLWYHQLPPHIREDVERSAVRLKIKRGKPLFRQGDPVKGLFGILSGEAQVIGTTIAGQDILVAMHRAGDWTGFLACLDGGNYTLTVMASQPCEVLHLPLAAVQRIFMQDVAAYALLAAPEHATQRAVYSHIVEHLSFTPLQRLARRLVDLAGSPHAEVITSRTIMPITQDQIALSIMTSRQWTNRLLQHLEKAGLIARGRSRIDILDLPRLTQLAIYGESGFLLPDLAAAPAEA
jgi:CRP/FNR family transcriptional regulator